uniref:Col_cuticle_N domain-containing protein n=1 Tax=Steinernema glaseri TaxID=37863 RepID=A0A1I7YKD7_9BILA
MYIHIYESIIPEGEDKLRIIFITIFVLGIGLLILMMFFLLCMPILVHRAISQMHAKAEKHCRHLTTVTLLPEDKAVDLI